MGGNTQDSQTMSTEPFIWVLIPLVAVFSIGTLLMFLWNKCRRHSTTESNAWPQERVAVAGPDVRRGIRWSPWSGMRSTEGLNELGEAPPPYDTKKLPAPADRHDTPDNASAPAIPLQEVENGALPPSYPAVPPPTHATNPRQ
ncbi:hypothetical protein AAL_00846 [Moelleriella libera RCEF 2490]|uniref:Uncharacterized protein n=1 Tax=Moelleriella libera RCEF 2490 TaxID=1081109 RepID=A0A166V8D5_9HYPO|nr:hypothetical protein AAL_00846 [Moelleriella libera RCEF 2490]